MSVKELERTQLDIPDEACSRQEGLVESATHRQRILRLS